MATKEEYIDVLCQMEELYYNNDNCTLAMNLFKEDINLLTRLVNEHYEERQETNLEHYYNDILKLNGSFSLINGKIGICQGICCSRCAFNKDYCQVGRVEWLKQPYKKPAYKLTKFENDLLKSYVEGNLRKCKFKDICSLNRMKEKGHFKGVDENATIGDILGNCEVI